MRFLSDVIFAKCVFLLTPLSLLAIIPAVLVSLKSHNYLVLYLDVFCFSLLILIGYLPGFGVNARKYLLVSLIYLAAFVLLLEFQSFGLGLVYLLSASVFHLLIFPYQKSLISLLLTLIFCVLFGMFIYTEIIKIGSEPETYLLAWVAISSNVLFLAVLFALIIPYFFSRLENTILEKLQVLDSLNQSNEELKKSMAKVTSQSAELEEYAFVASHDLQEQLRMISSYLGKIRLKYQDQINPQADVYFNFALQGAHRMKNIIQDLLEHSSVGKVGNSMEVVDIDQVVHCFCKSNENLIALKGIQIEVKDLKQVKAFKAPLTNAIHRILENALIFSREGVVPHVKIQMCQEWDFWKISIQDNGIGIDKQFFEKIFGIFKRLHNRQNHSGNGIGLSIAKKHIESWGGKIWLDSIPGEGTTFYFTIPREN